MAKRKSATEETIKDLDNYEESTNNENKKQTDVAPKRKRRTRKKVTKKKELSEEKQIYNIEGNFLHVKVGNDNNVASVEDVEEVRLKLMNLFEDNDINCVAFVTHHLVNIDLVL